MGCIAASRIKFGIALLPRARHYVPTYDATDLCPIRTQHVPYPPPGDSAATPCGGEVRKNGIGGEVRHGLALHRAFRARHRNGLAKNANASTTCHMPWWPTLYDDSPRQKPFELVWSRGHTYLVGCSRDGMSNTLAPPK